MVQPVLMPRLTIDMEKGTVLEWTAEEGDSVEKGQKIAVVFGDKVEWEIEAPAAGVLLKVLVGPDEEAGVAKPIAYIGEPGEEIPEETPEPAEAPAPEPASSEPAGAPEERSVPGRPKASPAAKRLARERGIDLAGVSGTGPGGRIVEADVLSHAGAAEGSSQPASEISLSPMRKTIAERMLRSWLAAPHFILQSSADMTAAAGFREENRRPGGAAYTWNDLVVAAVGRALAESEGMQRRWDGAKLTRLPGTNLGVAVHTDQGLVVPVVTNAGSKSLSALSAEIKEKAGRAREGRLLPEDLKPAALTVTNLGMFGIKRFSPVINHPECAILAVGAVSETPFAAGGMLGVRLQVDLDLAIDHRALDGADGAEFLGRVRRILETAAWRT